jgi:hypothetical protein
MRRSLPGRYEDRMPGRRMCAEPGSRRAQNLRCSAANLAESLPGQRAPTNISNPRQSNSIPANTHEIRRIWVHKFIIFIIVRNIFEIQEKLRFWMEISTKSEAPASPAQSPGSISSSPHVTVRPPVQFLSRTTTKNSVETPITSSCLSCMPSRLPLVWLAMFFP